MQFSNDTTVYICEEYKVIIDSIMVSKGYGDDELNNLRAQYPQLNINLLQDVYINQYRLSYCYYDINQDGIKELLISGHDNADNASCYFYSLYTLCNDQAISLITDCAYRIMLYACEDGSIIKYASGGAAYGEASVFKIDNSGEKLILNSVYDIDYEKDPNAPYYNGKERLTKEEFDLRYRMVDLSDLDWRKIE